MNTTQTGSRVTRRAGTKSKAFKYGGMVDKNKAAKSRYTKHTRGCACRRCRKRAARRKLFPQIGEVVR